MARRDIVVAGASAGGVEALREFVGGLSPEFPAALLVVLHVPTSTSSALAQILDRSGPLPAEIPVDGQQLEAGRIYVAPPDHHLLVRSGRAALSQGSQENGHRPAVDALFRSAAREFGPRAVGVVLSGTLDDGASGLAAIVRNGGAAAVQEPTDALYAGMPQAALAQVPEAVVAAASALADAVERLVREPATSMAAAPDPGLASEVAIANFDVDELCSPHRLGAPAGLGCPDCGGSLFALPDGGRVRYRCRVGHAWSAVALAERPGAHVETALWVALRTLEDKAALHRRIADSARERDARYLSGLNLRAAREAEESAELIRQLLLCNPTSRN
jgi:two-component system chemotaxis response regulator CheB